MVFQSNPYLIWQVLPGFLMFGLGLYVLTRPRKKRESNSLVAFLFGGTLWSLGNAIQWSSPDSSWQTFWNSFTYLGILTVPTAWLFLVVRFTGYFKDPFERLRNWFFIMPVLTFLAILTNDLHNLFFAALEPVNFGGFISLDVTWGPLFYAHTYYSYLLIGVGMVILLYGLVSNFSRYGVHAYGLVIGVLTPLIGNAIFLFGSFPAGFPDPTPLLFMVSGLTFTWAIIGSKLFETIPLAHDTIVKSLSAGVIVQDPQGRILDANPAALKLLELEPTGAVGRTLDMLLPSEHPLLDTLANMTTEDPGAGEIGQFTPPGTERVLEATLSDIQDNFGDLAGRLLQLKDVTDIRRAEENLAITQETFDSVLDTLHDAFYEADPNGIIVNANLAFVRALGFSTKEEVQGQHFRKFTDRRSVRDIFEKFKTLYKTRQAIEPFLYDYRTKDGMVYVGETVVVPIMRGDDIIGARGIVRDVTDRVRAEEEVARQKELLDGLLQNAPLAIVINDLSGQVSVVNPAFEQLFGYTQAEALNKSLLELLSTPELMEEMRALSKRMSSEEVYFAGKRKRKDGTLADVEIFSVPFYLKDEKYGTLVFYNDISERLKAEADRSQTQTSYRAILDTLKDPYVEIEPNGRVTYGNQAFANALEYENPEDVVGLHFRRFISRKTMRLVVDNFRHVIQTGQPTESFDLIYTTVSGKELNSEMVVSPIIEDGQVVGARGIVRDISERIKAAEVLREAKEAAENRARELSAINRVADQVSESLDLAEILQTVCQELTRIFPVRNAGIGLLDPNQTYLEIRAFYSVDPEEDPALGLEIPLEGNAASREVIRSKRAVVIDDAQQDQRMESIQDISRARGTKSIMIVPLLARGRVIGTIGMPALEAEHRFTEIEIELATTIASQIASAVDNAQLYYQTETARMVAESDLEIGSQIQSGFLPDTLPSIPGWEIVTHFHSARQVAGDFYDVFQFEDSNHTAFVIADVCDKGVGAALFMVLFRSLLRAFSNVKIENERIAEQLLEIIMKTNNYIAEIHGNSSMFATVFFGILDPNNNKLYYVNGGHEPPVVLDKDGQTKSRLMPSGPAVGLFPDLAFMVEEIDLDEGDIMVGFTDGTTDARNAAGEHYTEERLIKEIQSPWTSIFSMIFELQVSLRNHIGQQDQYDDITLISFRRKLAENRDYHAICRAAKMDKLQEMRDFVEAAAIFNALTEDAIFAFKLAAEEILMNIISYGYQGRPEGMIAIAMECDSEYATMKIWDDGTYFSPEDVEDPDVTTDLAERNIGGLGIFFVKEMMDVLDYQREENGTNLMILKKARH